MKTLKKSPVLLFILAFWILSCREQKPEDAFQSGITVLTSDEITDAEVEFVVWLGNHESRPGNTVSLNGEGWMAVTTEYEPRGYGFGKLYKVNSEGEIEWTKEFRSRDLEVHSIIKASDGNFILIGSDSPTWDDEQIGEFDVSTDDDGNEFLTDEVSSDFWVCKINEYGEVLQIYDNKSENDDFGLSGYETDDGFIVIAGTSFPPEKDGNFRLIKTGQEGELIWDKKYGFPEGQICDCAILTSGNSFLLGGTGNSWSADSCFIVILRADADGNEIWLKKPSLQGPHEISCMTETVDGNFAIAGTRYFSSDSSLAFLYLIDPSGKDIWIKYYAVKSFSSVASTKDGSLITAGGSGVFTTVDLNGEILRQEQIRSIDVYSVEIIKVTEHRIMVMGSAYHAGDSGMTTTTPVSFLALLNKE